MSAYPQEYPRAVVPLGLDASGEPTPIAPSTPLPVQSPGFEASDSHTRPNDTTAYTALDVSGESPADLLTFTEIGNVSGGRVFITSAWLRIDVAAIPSGMSSFRLHLYSSAPTAIADNAAFNLPSGDRAKYLGYLDIPTPVDLGDTLFARIDNLNFQAKLAPGSTTLKGQLQTMGGYTPTAQAVKTVGIVGVQA